MLTHLISDLNSYRTIAIFGFGKEGKSFYDFAQKNLTSTLIIVDENLHEELLLNAEVFAGKEYLKGLDKADLIVKSPGISLHNLGLSKKDYSFTSMSELFLKFFSKQTVGITGTKGKSTLATLLYTLLKNTQKDVRLCGNIGVPAFELLQTIQEDSLIIMELSSHQLLDIHYSPHISILINLFPEHLDYYESCAQYYDAKLNIFKQSIVMFY